MRRSSAPAMLLIEVAKIPPEGTSVVAELAPGEVHVEGERSFSLRPGGEVDCHVERGDDRSIHVRGRLRATLELECGRCLGTFALPVDQQLDLFYLPHSPEDEREAEDEVELSDRDVVVAYYAGDTLDLGDVLREQLFLSLPLRRVCREDCAGLCPECGADRNASPCGCAVEAPADERLSVLGQLFPKGSA